MPRPILVIGAGVSGLVFAQGLSKHGIPFEVYERDTEVNARAQGYRFRVSEEGLRALKQNLTAQHFEQFRHTCCSDTLISNAQGVALHPESGEAAEVPSKFKGIKRPVAESVDRTALRNVLLMGIEEHVHFGKSFKSYRETGKDITVTFTDQSEVVAEALVGADGTWSRVRQQLLPKFRLVDTEGRLIFGKTDMSQQLLDKFSPDCISNPSILLGQHRKFLLEPMYFNKQAQDTPADYVYWVIFGRSDEELLAIDYQTLLASGVVALAKQMTKDWHPSLRCLIDEANEDQTALFPIFSARPEVHMLDKAGSRVTLLGDAIHPMSPTAAGANTALRDADLLVRLLSHTGFEGVAESFRAYEQEMSTYASEAIENSAGGGRIFFSMKSFDCLPVV